MQVITQLSLLLANKPGTLAMVCQVLAKADINIHALCVSETLDHSLIRLIVDKSHEALRLLESRGTLVLENEVLLMEASNKTGSLEKICNKLAHGGVNIEYIYCSCMPGVATGALVLRPDNIAKALKALNARPAVKHTKKRNAKPVV